MLALVLVGALILQSAVGAPNRCTESCDEPVTSGATSGRTGNAYSSYSRYGSHSSWSSGSLGSRNGRLESLDENGIAAGAVGGLERPGTWEDKKHYVTDDGRGEMSYRAGQTVTNNGFSKFAQHSYRYGSHDNHQPKPDSQILTTAEFEREFQSMRQRISSFMSNFRLDAGSAVNANFLQDFTTKANLMTSQMNSVCNQVDQGSQMYQQMQQMIEQFRRDVEQRQREIESVVFQSTSSSSANANVNAEWATYPSAQPAQVQYPTRPSVNMEVVVTQQIEQELNVVHNMVAKFATSFGQPESSPQYLGNLDAEINAINQKIVELNSQTLQHETLRARYEQLKTYFESCVTSIRARIEEMDRRNRELEERRVQRERELRLEAERKAEERRLEQIRIQEENERIQREQQQLIQQQQWEQQQQQQQQQQLQQPQQQQYQPTLYPQSSGSSVQVSGSVEHTYTGSYGAQIHGTTGGSTGASGSFVQGSQGHQRPQTASVPEVDVIAATNRLQQDLNRLQSEVNRFNSYSMRLTSSNSASIVSEAESTAANLQNRINSLCDSSNRYQNSEIYNHAEELRQRLQGYLQSFQSQAASYTSQYNAQYSQSGQYANSAGYQSSARYGSVQPPKVSNVEFEHSRSTDFEVTGRHLPADGRYNSNARTGRYARSAGEDYGPFFDSNQESSLEYGQQQQQPILDHDYTYGRVDEVDSYDKPYGYDLRNPNTPDNFEDYSQRTGPVELPREYQPVRAFRQGATRHQSQRLHQTHQFEDLTYQPGAVDDYYARQYSQDPSAADSQWERENDSTQQRVSYGEAEDLENLDRPRSQKIDNAHGSVSDARNREINRYRGENRRQQINRLNQHPTDGYGSINGKPRIAGSYSKYEASQRTEQMTLEKSGFNYYSDDRTENPAVTSQQVQPISYDNSRLEQQTEEPQRVRPIAVHEKFEYAQKTENLSLEQSGFYDYRGSSENPKTAEYPQVTTVASPQEVGSALEIEDLNLENSGLDDYSGQTRNKKLNDKPQRIQPPLASNFEINQQNEKHDLQQSGFGSLYAPNEKLETFDEADLTQQTAGQVNFGAESQIGRSRATQKPGILEVDSQQNLKPDIQNLELENKRKHPVGQYIENLSQQHEQSSLIVESSNLNSKEPKVDDQAAEISTTTRYTHHLLPTVRPTVKPAPKPIPRYTRPWQVSQINNVPKKLETEEKQFERDNTKIEESINLQNLDKHSESLRGDLPGVSETSTVPVPVTTEKLDINQQVNSEYDSRQQFEQVNLNANSQLDDLQKSRNDWVQNNNRDSQFGQTNYFSQESIRHNYEHSQQSIHYSQQNNGQALNPSNYQPLQKQNNNGQQELLPHDLESDQLQTSIHEDLRQQVQTPLQQQQPSRFEQDITQREEEELAERVIPLEETKTINDLSETETTTAPPSFWKRVGHKLSNSFDKAKEKARNILG